MAAPQARQNSAKERFRMPAQPEKKKFRNAEVLLYRNTNIMLGDRTELVARMVIKYFAGNEDEVFVYERDGKRYVCRLKLEMIGAAVSAPAVSDSVGIGHTSEDVTVKEEEENLLAVFEQFSKGNSETAA
jgi:hypothetical protein